MKNFKPTIGIVSPCYNEEEVLSETSNTLIKLLESLKDSNVISSNSFLAYVDDGSKDNTWQIIKKEAKDKQSVKGLKLSQNVGHQNALLAGLLSFKDDADALISIDADLQDDISVIKEMIQKYKEGIDTVYGVRIERKTDTFFKKHTAQLFYKLMLFMKVNIIYNHADFRLTSQRVLDELSNFKESNLFLRGIIPTIGFKQDNVYYSRLERTKGESKYPLKKMLAFAWNGITSFSNYPLKLVTSIGFLIFTVCLLLSVYALFSYIKGSIVPGWFSTVLPIYFLGGIQLLCLGIIGEYIGKIFTEVKSRPLYIVEDKRE